MSYGQNKIYRTINNFQSDHTEDSVLVGYKPTVNFRRITNPPELLINGQIIILREGKCYNIFGQELAPETFE